MKNIDLLRLKQQLLLHRQNKLRNKLLNRLKELGLSLNHQNLPQLLSPRLKLSLLNILLNILLHKLNQLSKVFLQPLHI